VLSRPHVCVDNLKLVVVSDPEPAAKGAPGLARSNSRKIRRAGTSPLCANLRDSTAART